MGNLTKRIPECNIPIVWVAVLGTKPSQNNYFAKYGILPDMVGGKEAKLPDGLR